MPKRKGKSRGRVKAVRAEPLMPQESQAAETVTVAWMVAVTMTLVCDVAALGAYFYIRANPAPVRARLFLDLVTFAGVVIGAAALALIPIVYRMRRTPPPMGIAMFAACVAAAPFVVLVARAAR